MKLLKRIFSAGASALADDDLCSDVRLEVEKGIIEHGLITGEFTLSSGKTSHYYLDLRKITLSTTYSPLIAFLFLRNLNPDVEAVGGPTLGADPIIGAIVAMCGLFEKEMDGFLVRKHAKEHGRKKWLEGPLENSRNVALIEDVVTTGKSLLTAAEKTKTSGHKIIESISLVDREEENTEQKFKKEGIKYSSIFKISEILEKKGD